LFYDRTSSRAPLLRVQWLVNQIKIARAPLLSSSSHSLLDGKCGPHVVWFLTFFLFHFSFENLMQLINHSLTSKDGERYERIVYMYPTPINSGGGKNKIQWLLYINFKNINQIIYIYKINL
jgi:hypothetical protein